MVAVEVVTVLVLIVMTSGFLPVTFGDCPVGLQGLQEDLLPNYS